MPAARDDRAGSYAGRGDPRRTLELLWGAAPPPTRGRTRRLTVAQVGAAAIALADAEGLSAVSMRRVADQVGVSAMALYTYVPSRAELVDLMLDAVQAEGMPLDAGDAAAPTTPPWRAGLTARAHRDWRLYEQHPWVLDVATARAVLGPNELAVLDASVAVLDGLPLSGPERLAAVALVAQYVRGAAEEQAGAVRALEATGMSDDEWWLAREPVLDELMDAERFPALMALDGEGAFDPADAHLPYTVQLARYRFAFGLPRVLDGIGALIAART